MRRAVPLALLALLAAACAAPPAEELPGPRRPNVVLVLADDLGWAELGCYGQQRIRTPRVDALAAQGVRFTQHYSGSPVCAPSRCTLLTGLHTGHAFVRDNGEVQPEGQLPLPAATRTLAEALKAEGYATCAVGKWGLGGPETSGVPNRQGFDRWYGYLCQRHAHNHYPRYLWSDEERVELAGNDRGLTGARFSHDLFTEEALAFVRAHADEPFFLYVAYAVPHLAIQVPEDSLAEYEGLWEDPPYEGGKGYLPHPAPRAGYAAMVTRMDRDVGRLVDLVDELGLGDDTIFLFTSDNGPTYDRIGGSDSEFFASAGELRGLKGSVYEGGLRVPLVARWPGRVEGGRTSDLPSYFPDLMPTILELCGARVPDGLDGVSLAPTLLGAGAQRRHDVLYWEFPSYGGQQALRMGDWKAVRQRMRGGNTKLELYDLARDPGETTDLAAGRPDVIVKAQALLAREHRPSAEFPLPAIDAPAEPPQGAGGAR